MRANAPVVSTRAPRRQGAGHDTRRVEVLPALRGLPRRDCGTRAVVGLEAAVTDPFTTRLMSLDRPGLWALAQAQRAEIERLEAERDNTWQAHDRFVHESALVEYELRRDLAQARAALESYADAKSYRVWVEANRGDGLVIVNSWALRDCGQTAREALAALAEVPQDAKSRDTEALTGQSGTLIRPTESVASDVEK